MNFTRRTLGKLTLGLMAAASFAAPSFAADMPKPFDKPGDVKIALVRYLSTGDFFQSYLAGVEAQAKALGVQLQVFDSRQDAALQADMVDQAIALGVQGIIIQHGLTESMKEAAQRAVDAGIKVVAFDVTSRTRRSRRSNSPTVTSPASRSNRRSRITARASRRVTSMSPASHRSTAATRPGRNSRVSIRVSTKLPSSARWTTRLPTRSPTRHAR